jgi:ribonuclease Z
MRLLGRWLMMLVFLLAVLAVAGGLVVFSVPQAQDAIVERVATRAMGQTSDALLKDDALRAVVCGSSSPLVPSPDRARACIAIIAGGKIYFVDTGPQSQGRAASFRLPLANIGGVFFTHFHSDHIADLGEFNMNSWVLGRKAPLDVYGPPGVERLVAGYQEAYALDQVYRTAHHGVEIADPELWKMIAHPVPMAGEGSPAYQRTAVVIDDGNLKVTAIEVDHDPISPAYGYRFDYKGRSIVISGDTIKHGPLATAAKSADVLFHEAQSQDMVRTLQGVAGKLGNTRLAKLLGDIQNYHTSPVEAADLANEAGVKLLVFYHLTPAPANVLTKRMFVRGVSDVRKGDWLLSRDGTFIELPLGTQTVVQSNID